ncbi:MAG: class I SAM-dependent methyltransferase [Thermoguttaceae bacterium]
MNPSSAIRPTHSPGIPCDGEVDLIHQPHWDRQYQTGAASPWDTDRPSTELRRVLDEQRIASCATLELGCGTGTNAVWLAERGFSVTAVDISRVAICRAREKAAARGVPVNFVVGDLRHWERLGGPYDFFFDRGCYHAVRRGDLDGYLRTLEKLTAKGTWGLVLAGNAKEPEDAVGPPVVEEREIREEFGRLFEIVQLREFRFDAPGVGQPRYLGWSCLLRRDG